MKQHLKVVAIAALLLLGACAKETSLPNPTGKGSVRMLNNVANAPEFTFLIEERVVGTALPKNATTRAEYDDFSYTFNFEVTLAGDTARTRVASQPLDVQADMDYTMILSGAIDAPDVTMLETPQREWDGTETTFEVQAAHFSTTLGQVDIYILDEATVPAVGLEFATLGIGEFSTAGELESGAYVVTITPPGDDTTILFQSSAVTIAAQSQFLLGVYDGDENDVAPYTQRLFNLTTGGTGALVDSRFPPQIRFIHANLNIGDVDVYVDDIMDPMAMPIVSDHTFMQITPFLDIAAGAITVNYTTPGDTSSILLTSSDTIFQGTRTDYFLIFGATDVDARISNLADRRSVSTNTQLSIMNTVSNQDLVDFYIIPRGDSIDDYTPILPNYPRGTAPITLPITEGDYDIYVTVNTEKTVLAGPVQWTAVLGDVVETIMYDNVDPNVVDFAFIPPP